MKIKYNLAIILTLVFGSLLSVNSQEVIFIDKPVCEIPAVEDINDFKNGIRESVQQRMENNSSMMPCADFIVTYNGFPTDFFGNIGQEQIAFQYAVDIWANLIDSPVPIRIDANFAPAAATNLGSARPSNYNILPGGPTSPFNDPILYPSALYEKLIGEDRDGPSGTSFDIVCNFNSNRNDWYFGTDANPPNDEFDFVTVVLHEIGHGLGVAGFGTQLNNGEVAIRRDASGFSISASSTHVSIWDTYIDGFEFNFGDPLNPDTPLIIDESMYPDPSTPTNDDLEVQFESDNLTINSPIAINQNGGEQPKTYAPANFNGGSSYSHLDENTFNNTPHALMTPFSANGEANHDPGDIVLGFMEEMGWALCGRTLSTSSAILAEAINVSPNPFDNNIIVKIPLTLNNQEFKLSIVDINGRLISETTESLNNGEIELSNLANLKNALYFLTIESSTSDLKITKKLIKK
ncbi:T9SS type A sorting domain-containing protein [Winogradskyella litorisediminis]|uniref:T9SS type A sorting domain-containing protein n=1 Tax=Winogradskyella litorisediminis TaxID=1156618 RepID=A0ABW3N4E8_9FLAO